MQSIHEFIIKCELASKPVQPPPRGLIYRITNRVTGWVYIGKTRNRLCERYPAGEWWRCTHNRELKADYTKYGSDAFSLDIIVEGATPEELQMLEPFLISSHNCLYPNGYNHTLSSPSGGISAVTRERMSVAHKGKIYSQSHRDAIRQGRSRYKMSTSHFDHIRRGATHYAIKPVEQLDGLNGSVVANYPCIAEAARANGLSESKISAVCKNKATATKGTYWRFVK